MVLCRLTPNSVSDRTLDVKADYIISASKNVV